MNRELDDFQSDIQFGEWLRSQRVRLGSTIEQAAQLAKIPLERLKALELGLSERGITQNESVRLSTLYKLPLAEVLARATKS